jgi:hypothetical protein
MTDDQKIDTIVKSLRKNALGDISRASSGGSKMGAFILCSCLIDAIAGFIKGSDTIGTDYKDFISKYMPDYDRDNIWTDLRCKLVHSYSEGGSYWFTDSNTCLHLTTHSDGRAIVNLENFIAEIEGALSSYEKELTQSKDPVLRKNAIKRLDDNGIIGIISTSGLPTGESTPDIMISLSGR